MQQLNNCLLNNKQLSSNDSKYIQIIAKCQLDGQLAGMWQDIYFQSIKPHLWTSPLLDPVNTGFKPNTMCHSHT